MCRLAGDGSARSVARQLRAVTAVSDFMCWSVNRDVPLTSSVVIRTQNFSHKDLVTDNAIIRHKGDMK